MKGGVIPVFNNRLEKDPFIFDKYNVIFDGNLILYTSPTTKTVELQKDFSSFMEITIDEPEIQRLKEENNFSSYDLASELEKNPNLKKTVEWGKTRVDLTLLNTIQEDYGESFLNILRIVYEKLPKQFSKNEIVKIQKYFPFNRTGEIQPYYNLFQKYSFINKFYEFIDIVLDQDENDEKIKESILKLFDNNQTQTDKAFVNLCDYMTFLNIYSFYTPPVSNFTTENTLSKQQRTFAYYDKETKNFTQNLKKVEDYMKEEIQMIKLFKKVFSFLNEKSNSNGGLKPIQIILMFYIKKRIEFSSFTIPDRSPINETMFFFPISRKQFVNNILQIEKDRPFIITKINNLYNLYPKTTDYRSTFNACTERGVLEFLKFISFQANQKKFVAPDFIQTDFKKFIDKHSVELMSNDEKTQTEIFNKFVLLISNREEFHSYYKTGKTYEILSLHFWDVILKITTSSDIQILISKIMELNGDIKIKNDDNQIVLEIADITLTINEQYKHVAVKYENVTFDINNITNKSLKDFIYYRFLLKKPKQVKHSAKNLSDYGLKDLNLENVNDMSDLFNISYYYSINYNIDYTEEEYGDYPEFMFEDIFPNGVVEFDTSKVTTMNSMFSGCKKFNPKEINFDTSKVTTMNSMFSGCSEFNATFGDKWNTSHVKDMSFMFKECKKFNPKEINFDTSKVIYFDSMFSGCSEFNATFGDKWNTSNANYMSFMFKECKKFNPKEINFDTSKVIYFNSMFYGCSEFNATFGDKWNTSNAFMTSMFQGCTNFEGNGIESWIINFNIEKTIFYGTKLNQQKIDHLLLNYYNNPKTKGGSLKNKKTQKRRFRKYKKKYTKKR